MTIRTGEDDVASLAVLDLAGLRRFWSDRYGSPPRHRSTDLIRRQLAWRLQADIHGGLPPDTLKALLAATGRAPLSRQFEPGTVLSREWQGHRHQVLVTDAGYEHAGEVHRSLSEVARKITGIRWNGPRFFGLRGS